MKLFNWFLVAIGVAGLIAVRIFEDKIFYDPFLQYFHETGSMSGWPVFLWGKLIVSYCFRFGLNLFFSTLIVHFLFLDQQRTIQALVMMVLVFVVTFPMYLWCIYTKFEMGDLFSFYLRRFVIQPLTVLLVVPIFYYRKLMLK